MRRQPLRLARVAQPLIVFSLAAGAGAVAAQETSSGGSGGDSGGGGTPGVSALDTRAPYYIGLRQAFAHNDNLFDAPQGGEVSDVYSSTVLLGGIDQNFGRQHFYLDGSFNWDRYQDFTQLNNNGWNVGTGVNWQTIGFLSGTLRYNTRQSLADYGGPDAIPLSTKNVERADVYGGNIDYALTRRFALNAMGEHRKVEYSAPEYASREYSQNVWSGGVRYGLPELMTFGLGYRVTKTTTPEAQTANGIARDEGDRRDIDLTMTWNPSALSSLSARLSHSTEDHSAEGMSDVDGITGALNWNYRPTAKLTFDLGLAHDTGSEILAASITQPGGSTTVQNYDTDRVTDAAHISVLYQMTSKIRANLGFNGSKTTSDGNTGSNDETRTSVYQLGLTYAATERLSFGCSYNYEKQTADQGSVYKSGLTSCYGQFTLR